VQSFFKIAVRAYIDIFFFEKPLVIHSQLSVTQILIDDVQTSVAQNLHFIGKLSTRLTTASIHDDNTSIHQAYVLCGIPD
jgi:hypothetical protein